MWKKIMFMNFIRVPGNSMPITAFPREIRGFKFGVIGCLAFGAGTVCWVIRLKKRRELRRKAIEKRRNEQEYITEQLEILSAEVDSDLYDHVLSLTTAALLKEIKSGSLNPVDVVKIYLYKACKVTAQLNCVTGIKRDCVSTAQSLGDKSAADLPLYGIPVSLKECMKTEGMDSTIGLATYIGHPALEDCVLAKVLKHCGAVPFVKTNLPQLMLTFESSNPIYGETGNPHNPDFCPGGSSAGESAIIGAGASPLGFGTDIGGSIRVPAHFCGICGLKPTKQRLSAVGLTSSLPGQSAISAALGPMARDVDTLVMSMRALLCDYMFKLDPYVLPIPFRDDIYLSKKPLRIGFYFDDGYAEPIPACKRAVRITKEALEQAGHTLVPYKVPDVEYMINLATRAIYADGGRTSLERLEYNSVARVILPSVRKWRMHPMFRRVAAALLHFKYPRIAKDLMAYGGGDCSVYSLWKITAEIAAYQSKFLGEWREKYNIDALICPVYPLVACPKGSVTNMSALMSYTTLYTMTNCPAGSVNVTSVTSQDIQDLDDFEGHYGDSWDVHCKEVCKGSIDMPVGVQCVGYPWHEEVVLRLMKEVETLLAK